MAAAAETKQQEVKTVMPAVRDLEAVTAVTAAAQQTTTGREVQPVLQMVLRGAIPTIPTQAQALLAAAADQAARAAPVQDRRLVLAAQVPVIQLVVLVLLTLLEATAVLLAQARQVMPQQIQEMAVTARRKLVTGARGLRG
jgi:hypothetical protein